MPSGREMAASIAGVNWRAVSLIRECRRRCLPGGARVCSRAAILKYLVAAIGRDVFSILVVLLTLSKRIFEFARDLDTLGVGQIFFFQHSTCI